MTGVTLCDCHVTNAKVDLGAPSRLYDDSNERPSNYTHVYRYEAVWAFAAIFQAGILQL